MKRCLISDLARYIHDGPLIDLWNEKMEAAGIDPTKPYNTRICAITGSTIIEQEDDFNQKPKK